MEDKCHSCQGLCCTYVTVDLPVPHGREDFDEIRWYILHQNVVVYKSYDEENWRIEFASACVYLDKENHRCLQYDRRPQVCKQYETYDCGGVAELEPAGCQVFIRTDDDLREYLKNNKPEFLSLVFS